MFNLLFAFELNFGNLLFYFFTTPLKIIIHIIYSNRRSGKQNKKDDFHTGRGQRHGPRGAIPDTPSGDGHGIRCSRGRFPRSPSRSDLESHREPNHEPYPEANNDDADQISNQEPDG